MDRRGTLFGLELDREVQRLSDIRVSQLDKVHDVDIRQPSIHRQDLTWVTDYLIGCHNNDVIPSNRDNDLSLFLGSNE